MPLWNGHISAPCGQNHMTKGLWRPQGLAPQPKWLSLSMIPTGSHGNRPVFQRPILRQLVTVRLLWKLVQKTGLDSTLEPVMIHPYHVTNPIFSLSSSLALILIPHPHPHPSSLSSSLGLWTPCPCSIPYGSPRLLEPFQGFSIDLPQHVVPFLFIWFPFLISFLHLHLLILRPSPTSLDISESSWLFFDFSWSTCTSRTFSVTEIPFVDKSSKQELLSLLGDWYKPNMFNSVFSSVVSNAVFFSS